MFFCLLFENVNAPNGSKFCSSNGFNNWQKLNPKVANQESSSLHIQIFCKWKELESGLEKGKTNDKKAQYIVEQETKKWHDIMMKVQIKEFF